MHWILGNKEWLFSGIGVAILGSVLAFFVRRRTVANENTSIIEDTSMIGSPVATGSNISQTVSVTLAGTQPTPDARDSYSGKPAPDEIYSQLAALPIFQRDDAAKSYVGIRVSWPVRLDYLETLREGTIDPTANTHRVYLSYENSIASKLGKTTTLVSVDVNIGRNPRLKIAHEGDQMRISGTIENAGNAIRLKNAVLSFVD
jgi:hypothetical protein